MEIRYSNVGSGEARRDAYYYLNGYEFQAFFTSHKGIWVRSVVRFFHERIAHIMISYRSVGNMSDDHLLGVNKNLPKNLC